MQSCIVEPFIPLFDTGQAVHAVRHLPCQGRQSCVVGVEPGLQGRQRGVELGRQGCQRGGLGVEPGLQRRQRGVKLGLQRRQRDVKLGRQESNLLRHHLEIGSIVSDLNRIYRCACHGLFDVVIL